MKPWPKVLADRYPLSREVLPERPWWSTFPILSRSDGIKLQARHRLFTPEGLRVEDVVYGGVVYSERLMWGNFFTAEEAATEFDLNQPLPHPRLRVGQIWGNDLGGSIQIVAIDPHGFHPTCVDETDLPLRLAKFIPGLYPYLIADPSCPHLAPWSPNA